MQWENSQACGCGTREDRENVASRQRLRKYLRRRVHPHDRRRLRRFPTYVFIQYITLIAYFTENQEHAGGKHADQNANREFLLISLLNRPLPYPVTNDLLVGLFGPRAI